jgi:hypothetical protein
MNDVDAASSLAIGGDREAVCYLCLDGGVDDDDGQPLLRDCACRGTDAGFVHLSCLTNYAAAKSRQARGMIEFRKPWRDCPSCHQKYQNELAIDISSKFVSFVRRQYPDDTKRQVEALHSKLRALDLILNMLKPVQKKEARVTANVLLSLIDRMKREVLPPLPRRYFQFEGFAYNVHGRIALNEGTEESARRAVTHFEKALERHKAIGFIDGIATAKSNIAIAKSEYEGGNKKEEKLTMYRELYEMRVAKHGEGSELAINSGVIYAVHLQKADCGDEARDLLTKLLATSKQVLGPHHNTTKKVEAALSKCR